MATVPVKVSGWTCSRGLSIAWFPCLFSIPCLPLPPCAAVLWEALRKMGLRPGYDWAFTSLACLYHRLVTEDGPRTASAWKSRGIGLGAQGCDLGGWGNTPKLSASSFISDLYAGKIFSFFRQCHRLLFFFFFYYQGETSPSWRSEETSHLWVCKAKVSDA